MASQGTDAPPEGTSPDRRNCWESLQCGKEKQCPAYPDHGRTCFAVTATRCRGVEQGSYTEKIERCRAECAFYNQMMKGK